MYSHLEAFYHTVVDRIVDMVWAEYPDKPDTRHKVYDRLADSFAGLAKVLQDGTDERTIVAQIESGEIFGDGTQ